MTDVNCLTSEHIAPTTTTASPPGTPSKNAATDPVEPTSPFVLRAPPSAKSKLILQNMEEVLNSVKQKHREKHKRKREEKRRAALMEDQKSTTEEVKANAKEKPQPLREKSSQENGLKNGRRRSSPLKSSTPVADNQSIMKHFAKAGKPENVGVSPVSTAKPKPTTNVFEFMMNARNRSLGVNEGGAESPADQEIGSEAATPTTKRKLLLQEWNERKGGAKRRLADEARGEFIELQMEQRAKRLRKMLTKTDAKEVTAPSSAPTDPTVKRLRGRPRSRRISSMDAQNQIVESKPPVVKAKDQDPGTEELLSKLSSPTKKRDSLLGYFPKVESPKELAEKVIIAIETPPMETPKRRTLRRKSQQETPIVAESTPSSRPRRSCVGKARYDYDLETSPGKQQKAKPQKADESVEIIDLDNSNPAATPKKLAPLFVRQLPKPSPDPSVLKARQAFLQSGVPDKIRQEQIRQKNFDQMYEDSYEVFPRLAHIGCESFGSKNGPLDIPFALRAEEEYSEVTKALPANKRRAKASSITSCLPADFTSSKTLNKFNYATLPQLENKRGFVKLWKNDFDRFPTFKCYNQMREKYRHFSAIDSAQDTQQMGESLVVTRRTRRSMEQNMAQNEEEAKPPPSAPNGELLFTEKYKPLLFEQVLVNLTPVQELREFLSSWSGNGGSNRNSQGMDDTFDMSNDSASMGSSSNTMVLVGPSSSGKTNAVFTLANDMNFNVLEINAGMKRTGKKLIQELQEATQSHQIRKDGKAGGGSSQQLLQKLQKSGLKAKAAAVEPPSEVRKSLILIEDADILFDNLDAGFTDAIYTLAASSKRPVIVVATDPNCAHLQRLMQQNIIHFQAPNALNISRFLAVLSLMENCPIELDELISVYLYNQQNLRKTLMELQFYIQSGGDSTRDRTGGGIKSPTKTSNSRLATVDGSRIHQRFFEFFTSPQNVQYRIPFPVDFSLLRLNLPDLMASSAMLKEQQAAGGGSRTAAKRKSRSPKKAWLSSATGQKSDGHSSSLATLASFYDNISVASLMDSDCSDRLQWHLSEEIGHLLVEQALQTGLATKECPYNLFDKPVQRFSICQHLGNGVLRSDSAKSLDFEPALRSICRSEKERAGLERKSSRFYHYLRNHTVNVTSFTTDYFDTACSTFQSAAPSSEPTMEAEPKD
uniref:Enhanced level of genomic instability 1 n=2 Tax=Drosophila melanogaster TaxID=7227 RepID=ELG1_DROME|nr:enhanced level of genomic instability 1, isoform C [Drosophila melanogaster]Q86BP6.1 RecName: Full=Enhanced level of genomic instability 1 [Drosophila melanogaster]AAN11762.2 enhanced level of genomic instability 1, isoform C [Drosophila melanogaster]|eukprot:NP_996103.1 enhanced level of genomic instability 1, isoform C [Drosophila melanogaster]